MHWPFLLLFAPWGVCAEPEVFNTNITAIYVSSDNELLITRFPSSQSSSTAITTICAITKKDIGALRVFAAYSWGTDLVYIAAGSNLFVVKVDSANAVPDSAKTATHPAKPCILSESVSLGFTVAGLHPSSQGLVLLADDGGVWTWIQNTSATRIAGLSNMTAPFLSTFDDLNHQLYVTKPGTTQGARKILRVDVPHAKCAPTGCSNNVETLNLDGCDDNLAGIFMGDYQNNMYAWTTSPRAQGELLTVQGIGTFSATSSDKNSIAPFGASCSEVITTGGEGKFVTGATDSQGSVTAMATDALYVVDATNDRPDDLHFPVYAFEPSRFAALLYEPLGEPLTRSHLVV